MKEYNKHVLKIALEDHREENDKLLLEEIEKASSDPMFANTATSEEKLLKALNDINKTDKKKRNYKILLRVASVFLTLLIGLSVMTLGVKGFREKLWEFLSNIGNPSYSTMVASKNANDNKIAEYEGLYIPKYIPEGYEVVSVENQNLYKSITLKNSKGNTIEYTEHTKDIEKKFNLDKENFDSYETYNENGKEFIIGTTDNLTRLVVKEPDAVIFVLFNDNDIDIQSFAKMIEKK